MNDASGLTQQRHEWERAQEIRRVEYLRNRGVHGPRIDAMLEEESIEDNRRARARRIAGLE